MRLIYTSNPLSLVIENYEPMSFEYNGWEVSDKYECSDGNEKYSVIVSSKEVSTNDELESILKIGKSVIEKISTIIPFVSLLSLRRPLFDDIEQTTFKNAGIHTAPKGWSFNYIEVVKNVKHSGLILYITDERSIQHVKTTRHPLIELKYILENYDSLSEKYRFLIFLHNAILESEDANRYMLIGKALEIVNAIYPYERQRGRSDDRIERLHPELLTVFGATTIKDLIEWSNNRQESRHYVGRGTNPHPPLTMEEKEQLYTCSVYLITNIIRLQLGLEVITFKQDEVQI